jgi:hypothetical protein
VESRPWANAAQGWGTRNLQNIGGFGWIMTGGDDGNCEAAVERYAIGGL